LDRIREATPSPVALRASREEPERLGESMFEAALGISGAAGIGRTKGGVGGGEGR